MPENGKRNLVTSVANYTHLKGGNTLQILWELEPIYPTQVFQLTSLMLHLDAKRHQMFTIFFRATSRLPIRQLVDCNIFQNPTDMTLRTLVYG